MLWIIKIVLKMAGIILGSLVTLILIAGVLFLWLSPQFGASANKAQKEMYARSGHFREGRFVNEEPVDMSMDFKTILSVLRDFARGNPQGRPQGKLPVDKVDSMDIAGHPDTLTRVTWFGHSAFLLETNGQKILIDPMLGESPSPLPLMGSKRFSSELPIAIEQLPSIDAVLISHDHYDHLDYESIIRLKDKVGRFYTTLGVGNHLKAWGVDSSRVFELNWWEETGLGELTFICAPARHFSGRGLGDRFATLWCSWIIQSPGRSIFFSGDSGYGDHFLEIGDQYGPFDLALIECGQYDHRWADIHMMPEESVQAAIDVKAQLMMPIHWGAFTLSLHDWTDPVERSTRKAREMGMPIATPRIGEAFTLKGDFPNDHWWKEVD